MARSITCSTARGAALITALLATMAGSITGSTPGSAAAAAATTDSAKSYIVIFVEDDDSAPRPRVTAVLFQGRFSNPKEMGDGDIKLEINIVDDDEGGGGGSCVRVNGIEYCP